MKTLVELIEDVEQNLKDLQEAEKRTAKALKAIEEERDDIMANIAMFEKVLADLTGIKEKECNEIMSAEKAEKKVVGIAAAKKVVATDEKGDVIAEYGSTAKAAKDLRISQPSVSHRIHAMTKEKQIRNYGYALMFA